MKQERPLGHCGVRGCSSSLKERRGSHLHQLLWVNIVIISRLLGKVKHPPHEGVPKRSSPLGPSRASPLNHVPLRSRRDFVSLALEFIPARPLARCHETAKELHFLARAILCVGQVGNLSYVFSLESLDPLHQGSRGRRAPVPSCDLQPVGPAQLDLGGFGNLRGLTKDVAKHLWKEPSAASRNDAQHFAGDCSDTPYGHSAGALARGWTLLRGPPSSSSQSGAGSFDGKSLPLLRTLRCCRCHQ